MLIHAFNWPLITATRWYLWQRQFYDRTVIDDRTVSMTEFWVSYHRYDIYYIYDTDEISLKMLLLWLNWNIYKMSG